MMTNLITKVSTAAMVLCASLAAAGQPPPTDPAPPTDAVPVLVPPAKVISLHRPTADWTVVTSIVLSIEPTTEPKVTRVFRWTQPNKDGEIKCPGTEVSSNEVSVPDGTTSITCTYNPKEKFKGIETFAFSAKFDGGKYAKDAVVEIEVRERGLRWEFKTNATTITSDSPDPDDLAQIPDIIGGTSQDFLFTVNWQTMRPGRPLKLEAAKAAEMAKTGFLRREDLKVREGMWSRAANFLFETGVQSEAVAATVTDIGASVTDGGGASEPAPEPEVETTEQQVARRNMVFRGEVNYNATLKADGVGRLVEIGGLAKGSFSTVLDSNESFKEAVGRVLQVVPKDKSAYKVDLGLRVAVKQAHELDSTTLVSSGPEGKMEPPTNIENAFLFEFVPLRFDSAVSDVATDGAGGDSRWRWTARAEFSPEIELLPGHSAPTIGFEVSKAWDGGPTAVKITYGVNLSASKGILKPLKPQQATTR